MKLDGKVAIITGAGSGMSRATSLLFAREGAKIAAVEDRIAVPPASYFNRRRQLFTTYRSVS